MKKIATFATVLLWVVTLYITSSIYSSDKKVDVKTESFYSDFIQKVRSGEVNKVKITGRQVEYETTNLEKFQTYNPGDLGLMGDLIDAKVLIETIPPKSESVALGIFTSILPILLLFGLLMYMTKGSSGGILGVGKSKAKMMTPDMIDTTLDDVAGATEAKKDIEEVVDFLSNPRKYMDIGGSIPRGVLLTGPPGTGKTLLAKAVAGSATVPFFFISGSDFVEMFVGVGSSRVRDMFAEAKKVAPCIIFIDEIDAIGGQRGGMQSGGSDEREQTLNQMLVEMDGFEKSDGVIVLAATNRPDVLDKALLRPGRFDRQIVVGLPDILEREAILKVHAEKIEKENIIFSDIARGTPGFSGADLANLINESAILAAKLGKKAVDMECIEIAKDKILMGSERKSMAMDEDVREATAYHEAGHAIVGRLLHLHDPVYKVSILPRGRALGVTMFLPEKDKYSVSYDELSAQISCLYGGRIAEEMVFGLGSVSTGASNDIERATKMANDMVCKYGMGDDSLGPILYEPNSVDSSTGLPQDLISQTKKMDIERNINLIISANHKIAKDILTENIDILHAMAASLIKKETIDSKDVDELMRRSF